MPARLLILIALNLSSLHGEAYALDLIVKNPCGGEDWLNETLTADLPTSVGEVSVSTFDSKELQYVGNATGINQIRDTVIGDEAMEILSPTSMRAYGWCYEIDGVSPDVLADEAVIEDQDSVVIWYFGFALYEDGAWITYCTPTHVARPSYICQDRT